MAGRVEAGGAKTEACPEGTLSRGHSRDSTSGPEGRAGAMATTLWGPERDLKLVRSRPDYDSDGHGDQSEPVPAVWRTGTLTVLGGGLDGGGISSAARGSDSAMEDQVLDSRSELRGPRAPRSAALRADSCCSLSLFWTEHSSTASYAFHICGDHDSQVPQEEFHVQNTPWKCRQEQQVGWSSHAAKGWPHTL